MVTSLDTSAPEEAVPSPTPEVAEPVETAPSPAETEAAPVEAPAQPIEAPAQPVETQPQPVETQAQPVEPPAQTAESPSDAIEELARSVEKLAEEVGQPAERPAPEPVPVAPTPPEVEPIVTEEKAPEVQLAEETVPEAKAPEVQPEVPAAVPIKAPPPSLAPSAVEISPSVAAAELAPALPIAPEPAVSPPPEIKVTEVPKEVKLEQLPGPTPPAQGRIGVIDWEEAAFRAAFASGILRNSNETATEFFSRVNSAISKGINKPGSVDMAHAVYATIMEAHRGLTERQMAKLSKLLEDHVDECASTFEVPKNPKESFLDYVARVRGVMEARPRGTETQALEVPSKELAGLNWSLTLFRVFLEGYLGQKDTDQVMEVVEREPSAGEAPKHVHKLGEEDDFSTYAALVKNALKNLSARGIAKEKVEQVLSEFDDFVRDMSKTAPNVPGLTKSPEDRKKEAPERMKKMFEWMEQDVP